MDDLVERLANASAYMRLANRASVHADNVDEAADRISALEAQLAARDAAGLALYEAGRWELHDSAILPHEQAVMWERLRDAMGLQPGHSTALAARPNGEG